MALRQDKPLGGTAIVTILLPGRYQVQWIAGIDRDGRLHLGVGKDSPERLALLEWGWAADHPGRGSRGAWLRRGRAGCGGDDPARGGLRRTGGEQENGHADRAGTRDRAG